MDKKEILFLFSLAQHNLISLKGKQYLPLWLSFGCPSLSPLINTVVPSGARIMACQVERLPNSAHGKRALLLIHIAAL